MTIITNISPTGSTNVIFAIMENLNCNIESMKLSCDSSRYLDSIMQQ